MSKHGAAAPIAAQKRTESFSVHTSFHHTTLEGVSPKELKTGDRRQTLGSCSQHTLIGMPNSAADKHIHLDLLAIMPTTLANCNMQTATCNHKRK